MRQEDRMFRALFNYTKALSVALGYRDELTLLHSERVQELAEALGEAYGLSEDELNTLKVAAAFHDIGKIGIPDHILLKPDRFDETELEVMKKHAEIGERIMAATELEDAQQAAQTIRHHHEHFDGTGYPDGLTGEEIPICSRIISIADSYDAMAMTRTYHHSRTHREIMVTMEKETGRKHDPQLMKIFSGIIESSQFKSAQI
jgi:HD-GYP domain-containing protein (c-di-GMP phosphodiesterase class II)